ncbi:MAG: YIP1 family protein [Candidatus Methylomirabilaceae bacterium]
MEGLLKRMVRAAKLDSRLYEEVEADKGALGQATAVVFLASLAAGVGATATDGIAGLLFGTVSSLAGWYVWAFLTYWIGTRFLPEPQTSADYGELLRTIGFSSAPGVIRVVGVVPGLTMLIFLAASIWMLVAMVVAVRQALDYTGTLRSVAVCAIGWVAQVLVILLLLTLLRGAGGGS